GTSPPATPSCVDGSREGEPPGEPGSENPARREPRPPSLPSVGKIRPMTQRPTKTRTPRKPTKRPARRRAAGAAGTNGDAISPPPTRPLDIVIIGLTITSSWGNGHATTYRGLVRELTRRGHRVLFLERDMPWYAGNRDMPNPPFGRTELYNTLDELKDRFAGDVAKADVAIVGSYVPDGI